MHNERYSILYSSATGNTRLLADTIRAALPPELCDAFGAAGETAAESELLYVGFWTDKGNADADTLALLRTLKNKRLFVRLQVLFPVNSLDTLSCSDVLLHLF